MGLYQLARRVNAQVKKVRKYRSGRVLSPVRRIERVYPPAEGRFVAMTFDDGPTTLPTTSDPAKGLTASLLDTLAQYGAKGTFDVIGTTAGNYPDEAGKAGDFTWSGVHFDHYPRYGEDKTAGAVNCPELIGRILAEGHEITSHTYSHRLWGPMRAVYGKRVHFTSLAEVTDDLRRLDRYLAEKFDYHVRLSRPPHYIDRIPDGADSYDAYRVLGYQYLAASFDGAGWQPLESYEAEAEAMVEPLRRALEKDPDVLNGRIIFQKDGCNMNERTPVADALGRQLALLARYGYRVVTVSELLDRSPFEDLPNDCAQIDDVRYLLARGQIVGYRSNIFAPKRRLTADEFMLMAADPAIFRAERAMNYAEMKRLAREYAAAHGLTVKKCSGDELLALARAQGIETEERNLRGRASLTRLEAVPLLRRIVERREE